LEAIASKLFPDDQWFPPYALAAALRPIDRYAWCHPEHRLSIEELTEQLGRAFERTLARAEHATHERGPKYLDDCRRQTMLEKMDAAWREYEQDVRDLQTKASLDGYAQRDQFVTFRILVGESIPALDWTIKREFLDAHLFFL